MVKLDIKKLSLGAMTNTGSSVLKSFQNETDPVADLFIREVLQNALDQYDPDTIKLEKDKKYVHVDFTINDINSIDVTSILSEIGGKLHKRVNNIEKCLIVRDKNTKGLTGPTTHEKVRDGVYGNYLKLVMDLAKPQTAEGAGGSWGLGKTIYYRLGIGLVFYYSRFIDEETNKPQERLIASMIENETLEDAIIDPHPKSPHSRTGIAWWGKCVDIENEVLEPVTDTKTIENILTRFNIERYEENETGTTVIIPFINEKTILSNNSKSNKKEQYSQDIYGDLLDFFKDSIQRWYFPRLNNFNYKYKDQVFLTVSFNNENFVFSGTRRYFNVLSEMYNYAINSNNSFFKANNLSVYREDIQINNRNGELEFDNRNVGTFVFGKFTDSDLDINDLSPYFLSGIGENEHNNENPPIISFCRAPGMILNYEITGEWVKNISSTKNGEYLLGLFVLNSNNNLTYYTNNVAVRKNLDEYARELEQSDHKSWIDKDLGNVKTNIIGRIQNRIVQNVKAKYEQESLPKHNAGKLSRLAASYILPRDGFGSKPRIKKNSKTPSSRIQKTNSKSAQLDIFENEIKFLKNEIGMNIPIQIEILKENIDEISLELLIKQERKNVTIENFEKDTLKKSPLKIKQAIFLYNEESYVFSEFKATGKKIAADLTKMGTVYNLRLKHNFIKGDILEGEITIISESQGILPSIQIK